MNVLRQAGILCLLLAAGGCGTIGSKPVPAPLSLSEEESRRASALSLYGSGLLHEEAEGVRSPAALSNFLAAAAAAK